MSPYCPLGSHGLGGAILCVYSVSSHEKVFAPFLMSSGFVCFFVYSSHLGVSGYQTNFNKSKYKNSGSKSWGKKVIQICLALCGKVAALNMRDNKENESYRFFPPS